MFRCKTMPLDEWPQFQAQFEDHFSNMFGNDNRLALFIDDAPAAGPRTLLITEHNAEFFERLSPGNWEGCDDAHERPWILLVGDNGANEAFGLPRVKVG